MAVAALNVRMRKWTCCTAHWPRAHSLQHVLPTLLLWQLAPIPTNHPTLRRMTSTLSCPHSCWRR